MRKFIYDINNEISPPTIVLSTKYHKHLGVINNISNNIANDFNMASHQEISFDVYKTLDENVCELWDQIVDLKYIFVPEHNEYYEIQVTIDDADNTIKHCVGVSAGEAELSQRYLRDFHCNDETDILFPPKYQVEQGDEEKTVVEIDPNGVVDFAYDTDESTMLDGQDKPYMASVMYRPINGTDDEWIKKKKARSSLLHRVLHDKCPDWSIGHIDDTLVNIQRTFTADGSTIYDFLTNTVATEIGCLFLFDSVNRKINVYDLKNNCITPTGKDDEVCGYRGDFVDKCPKCGGTKFIRGYGAWKKVYVSPENTALQMTVDGDADSVKNCFKISGGDDLMTATVVNVNPNHSPYIYRFSDAMKADMPKELVDKLEEYESVYQAKLTEYTNLTDQWYEAVDNILNLKSKMMPETPIPKDTTAQEQLDALMSASFTVAVQDITTAGDTVINNSVTGYAKVLIDPRYTVEVSDTTISPVSGKRRTWRGKFTVKSLGGLNKDGKPDEATSTTQKTITVVGNDAESYEEFLYQKIVKQLDRSDAAMKSLFDIESDDEFKDALELYCLDRLSSFSNTYQAILDVLIKMEVSVEGKEVYGVDVHDEIYMPYYTRKGYIDAEIAVREGQIEEAEAVKNNLETQREAIQKDLDISTYLGDELYNIFLLYLREDTYSNSNYISEGLDNSEIINKARELFDVAQNELIKASELQFTLTGQLANFLNTEEFKEFKDEFEIGDYIICKADDKLYRLRIVNVSYSYDNPADIQITFSNAIRGGNFMSDVSSILSQASSMATSYNYVARQASQGNEANNTVKSFENNGLNSAVYNIIAGKNQDIVIDSHGITAREYDDTINGYSPEQLKITSHSLAFTTNNWETASLSLGRHTFTYWDINTRTMVTRDLYGLSADFINSGIVVGSQIVAGYILSKDYNDTTKEGAYIDLENGYFTFADGKLVFDQNGLSISAEIDASRIDDATITDSIINNNNKFIVGKNGNVVLDGDVSGTAWATKQDKLTAGANIIIDGNVISATGGTVYEELTQAEYDALTPAEKSNGTIYFITDGEGGGGGGSKVIINPTGTATGVMNKISVDGIIYSVPTGVIDVEVDSVSVVTNGVAHINLSGYATTAALTSGLATKQDTLSAGANVNITNNVISATDTTYTAGTNITITNGVISASGGTEVEANPSGTATDTLNTVDIDGTIYEIQGGGGGTTVIPNPQGTPTDTLNTISINDTIFDIASGGGTGSGVYIEEVLWEGTESTSAWASPIELAIDIEPYDFIVVQIANSMHILSSRQIPTGTITGDISIAVGGYLSSDVNNRYAFFNKDTNLLRIFTSTGTSIEVTKIVGIKVSGNMFAPQIYSTEEREVGVWIDGRPLYQVTLTQNEVPALLNTGQTRHINLGLSNIENIWVMDASIGSNNAINIPYIHYNTRNLFGYFWDMNNGSPILEIRAGIDSSAFVINCITLQYTKSTDTPGSGSWASNGVPAHHYSTDEQVVGTWIDGSTVYEKTIELSTNVTVTSDPSNISNLADFSGVKQPISAITVYDATNDEQTIPVLFFKHNGAVYISSSTAAVINKLIIQYTKTT